MLPSTRSASYRATLSHCSPDGPQSADLLVERVEPDDAGAESELGALLVDAVVGGASVGFLAPLDLPAAIRW